jgi:2'-5' RNA ligase
MDSAAAAEPLRLFIALPLPEPALAELAAVQRRLRNSGHPVRWADPQGIHLTLQFLGPTDPALVQPLLEALSRIAPAPFPLHLGPLGAFPGLREPRIVWVGLAGDTAALSALQAAVAQATAPFGFVPEARPFHPHLTLGRTRPEARPEQRRRLGATLAAAAPPQPVRWMNAGPLLYASTLTPQGAVYRVLGPGSAEPGLA